MTNAKIGIFKARGLILIHETTRLSTRSVKSKYELLNSKMKSATIRGHKGLCP